MRILVVAYWFPVPPDNGARQRQLQILRHLSRRHEVSLLSFYDDDQQPNEEALATLAPYCQSVEVLGRRTYSGHDLASTLEVVRGRVPWITRRWNPEMTALVRRSLGRSAYDLLLLSHVENLPLLDEVSVEIPIILEQFEAGTIWDRPEERHGWAKARAAGSMALWARYLRRRLTRVAAVTVAAERERLIAESLIAGMSGRPRVVTVPNGVDLDSLPYSPHEPEPGRLIYQGALNYEPNLDAVLFFMDQVMPRIRQVRPDAHLVVTGPTSHDPRLEPHAQHGLRLTGYVEDVRPEVTRSAACVVPARLGSGTKTKVLEAMALGTPVLATTKGVEGLDVVPGVHALVADEPEELARLALQLMDDPQLQRRLSAAARERVETQYDYAAIIAELGRVCEEIAAAWERPA